MFQNFALPVPLHQFFASNISSNADNLEQQQPQSQNNVDSERRPSRNAKNKPKKLTTTFDKPQHCSTLL